MIDPKLKGQSFDIVLLNVTSFLYNVLYAWIDNLFLSKQTPDGANAVTIGELGEISGPMVILGGNCSLQGYDLEGNENFWTVNFALHFKSTIIIFVLNV